MTPEQLAAFDRLVALGTPITMLPRGDSVPSDVPADELRISADDLYAKPPPGGWPGGAPLYRSKNVDDWGCLRVETRKGELRFIWESRDGEHVGAWNPREKSNTQLALFMGFLKSFVMKQHGRVPADRSHLDKGQKSE